MTKILFSNNFFPKLNYSMRGYVKMLLQIATINKYCYSNEINKTTNDESFASVVF